MVVVETVEELKDQEEQLELEAAVLVDLELQDLDQVQQAQLILEVEQVEQGMVKILVALQVDQEL